MLGGIGRGRSSPHGDTSRIFRAVQPLTKTDAVRIVHLGGPLRAAIQDLFDGLEKRCTVRGPGWAAPGDIPVGTHQDCPVVADLVVIKERVVALLTADPTVGIAKPSFIARILSRQDDRRPTLISDIANPFGDPSTIIWAHGGPVRSLLGPAAVRLSRERWRRGRSRSSPPRGGRGPSRPGPFLPASAPCSSRRRLAGAARGSR